MSSSRSKSLGGSGQGVEITANIKNALKTIVSKLSKLGNAGIFMYPVDKSMYPEYYTIIKHPMCINQVKSNINSGLYNSVGDCLNDLRLIWENCRTFNAEGSDIISFADSLAKSCEGLIEENLGQEFRLNSKITTDNSKGGTTSDDQVEAGEESSRSKSSSGKKRGRIPTDNIKVETTDISKNSKEKEPTLENQKETKSEDTPSHISVMHLDQHTSDSTSHNTTCASELASPLPSNTIMEISSQSDNSQQPSLNSNNNSFQMSMSANNFSSSQHSANSAQKIRTKTAPKLSMGQLGLVKLNKGTLNNVGKLFWDFLADLLDLELCDPFRYPVRVKDYPKYYEIITNPIDVTHLRNKLDYYQDHPLEFLGQVDLIFNNAYKFFPPDSDTYKKAKELQVIAHYRYNVIFPRDRHGRYLTSFETLKDKAYYKRRDEWHINDPGYAPSIYKDVREERNKTPSAAYHTSTSSSIDNVQIQNVMTPVAPEITSIAPPVSIPHVPVVIVPPPPPVYIDKSVYSHKLSYLLDVNIRSQDEIDASIQGLKMPNSRRVMHTFRDAIQKKKQSVLERERQRPWPSRLNLVPGIFEIISLGHINAAHGFHTDRAIHPVAYQSKRNVKIAVSFRNLEDSSHPEVRKGLVSLDVISTILVPVTHRVPRFATTTESGIILTESSISPYHAWCRLADPDYQYKILDFLYVKLKRCRAVFNKFCASFQIPACLSANVNAIKEKFDGGLYDNEIEFVRDMNSMFRCENHLFVKDSRDKLEIAFESLFVTWVMNVRDKSIESLETGPWDAWYDVSSGTFPVDNFVINPSPINDKTFMNRIYLSQQFKNPTARKPYLISFGLLGRVNPQTAIVTMKIPSWETEFLRNNIFKRTFEMAFNSFYIDTTATIPDPASEDRMLLNNSDYLEDLKLEYIPHSGYFGLDVIDVRLKIEISMDYKSMELCTNYKPVIEEEAKKMLMDAFAEEKSRSSTFSRYEEAISEAIQSERWVWERHRMHPPAPFPSQLMPINGHKEGFAPLFPANIASAHGEALLCIWDFLDCLSKTSAAAVERVENVYSFKELTQCLSCNQGPNMASYGGVMFDEIGIIFASFLFADLRISYKIDTAKWWHLCTGFPLNTLTWTYVAHRAILVSDKMGHDRFDAIYCLESNNMNDRLINYEIIGLIFSHPAHKTILGMVTGDKLVGSQDLFQVLREIRLKNIKQDVVESSAIFSELLSQLLAIASKIGNCLEVKTVACMLANYLKELCGRYNVELLYNPIAQEQFDEALIISSYPVNPIEDYVLLPWNLHIHPDPSPYNRALTNLNNLEKSLALLRSDNVGSWSDNDKITVLISLLDWSWRTKNHESMANEKQNRLNAAFKNLEGIPLVPSDNSIYNIHKVTKRLTIEGKLDTTLSGAISGENSNAMVVDEKTDDSILPEPENLRCYYSNLSPSVLDLLTRPYKSKMTYVPVPSSMLQSPSVDFYSVHSNNINNSLVENSASSAETDHQKWAVESVLAKICAAREFAQLEKAKLTDRIEQEFNPYLAMDALHLFQDTGWKQARTHNLRSQPLGYDRYGRQYWLLNVQENQTIQPFNMYSLRDLTSRDVNDRANSDIQIDPAVLVREPDGWWGYHSGHNLPALIDSFDDTISHECLLKQNMSIRLCFARGHLISTVFRPRPLFLDWQLKKLSLEKSASEDAMKPLPSEAEEACKQIELVYARLCEARMQAHYALVFKNDFDPDTPKNTRVEKDAYARKVRKLKESHQDDTMDFHPGKGWFRLDHLSGVRALACTTIATRLHANINYIYLLRDGIRRSAYKQHWIYLTSKVVEEYMKLHGQSADAGEEDEGDDRKLKSTSGGDMSETADSLAADSASMDEDRANESDNSKGNSYMRLTSSNTSQDQQDSSIPSNTSKNEVKEPSGNDVNSGTNTVEDSQMPIDQPSSVTNEVSGKSAQEEEKTQEKKPLSEVSKLRSNWPNLGGHAIINVPIPNIFSAPTIDLKYRPLTNVVTSTVICDPKILVLKAQLLSFYLVLPEKLLKWSDDEKIIDENGEDDTNTTDMAVSESAPGGAETNNGASKGSLIEDKAERKKKRREKRKLCNERVLQEIQEATTPAELMDVLMFIESAIPFSWYLDFNRRTLPSRADRDNSSNEVTVSSFAIRLFTIDRLMRYEEIPSLDAVPFRISVRPRVNFAPKCFIASNCRGFICHPGKCLYINGDDEGSRLSPIVEPQMTQPTMYNAPSQHIANLNAHAKATSNAMAQSRSSYQFPVHMTQQMFNQTLQFPGYNFSYFQGVKSSMPISFTSNASTRPERRKSKPRDDDDDDEDADLSDEGEDEQEEDNPLKRTKTDVSIDFLMPNPPLNHLMTEFDFI